jgi:6-phosphogluconolactonase
MKFSVDGKFIFLINEITLTLSTFSYDAATGGAELVATTPTLSPAMKAKSEVNTGSEVLVHPNGQYVYAANRGHDSVTGFQIDPETGHLYVVDNEPIRGAWPRHINMDAGGRWLLAAGARSASVTVFAIDPATGGLTYEEGSRIEVPNPICILIDD